jgi:hypothetical protein
VRLDTTPPGLSGLRGGGATFYPYPDGFADLFRPSVVLGEAATMRLYVSTTRGVRVRLLTAGKSPGRVSLAWNGRDSRNRLVRPGTYRWRFTATDAAGNVRKTAAYYVTVR